LYQQAVLPSVPLWHGARQPELTCFGRRWFRDRTTCEAVARDHSSSRATAYRYVDEVIEVLAKQVPDLREALERARGGDRSLRAR
jgi:hypothetical protein